MWRVKIEKADGNGKEGEEVENEVEWNGVER
jgi:hypothetical protein